MTCHTRTLTTASKSPVYGGGAPTAVGRGLNLPQTYSHPYATQAEIPHHSADSTSPHPAPNGEEEEELKQKNKPTFTHVTP
jgi:hypothetical protein